VLCKETRCGGRSVVCVCVGTQSVRREGSNILLQSEAHHTISGVPRNFVRERLQQIQLRTEGRENGDLGTAAS
jgi:hypothetical protein